MLYTDISDHFPIVHIKCLFLVEETVSCLVTRVYNERNKQKFLQHTELNQSFSFYVDFFTWSVIPKKWNKKEIL